MKKFHLFFLELLHKFKKHKYFNNYVKITNTCFNYIFYLNKRYNYARYGNAYYTKKLNVYKKLLISLIKLLQFLKIINNLEFLKVIILIKKRFKAVFFLTDILILKWISKNIFIFFKNILEFIIDSGFLMCLLVFFIQLVLLITIHHADVEEIYDDYLDTVWIFIEWFWEYMFVNRIFFDILYYIDFVAYCILFSFFNIIIIFKLTMTYDIVNITKLTFKKQLLLFKFDSIFLFDEFKIWEMHIFNNIYKYILENKKLKYLFIELELLDNFHLIEYDDEAINDENCSDLMSFLKESKEIIVNCEL